MALVWGSITISDWYHEGDTFPEAHNIKFWGYPNASGMTSLYMGSGADFETAEKVYFFSEGARLNAFYEDSESAILAKEALIKAVTAPATLAWGSNSKTNMMLVPGSFRYQSEARKCITSAGATKYFRPFIATFVKVKRA